MSTISQTLRCFGLSQQELRDRLAGPNVLLNLSNSLHPPLLLEFERRIFCDLDPSEIFYWMTKLEMGQSHHHEFWTIGLNVHGARLSAAEVAAPLADFLSAGRHRTASVRGRVRARPKFTTIGQWYWGGAVEVNGEFPDLSKKHAFEPYLDLPARVPEARWELAMNFNRRRSGNGRGSPDCGWHLAAPHRGRVARRRGIGVILPPPRANSPRSKASM